MKILIGLFVLGFGVFAQANCPDVSGKFAGMCTQTSTCKAASQVYYGVQITQMACNAVTISRLSPMQAIFTASYPVGTAVRRSHGNLNSFLSYTETGLRFAIGGSRTNVSSVELLTKVTDASGVTTLHVESESGSPYCQYRVSCSLAEIAR